MKTIKIREEDHLKIEEIRIYLMKKGKIKSLSKIDLLSLMLKAYTERILKIKDS